MIMWAPARLVRFFCALLGILLGILLGYTSRTWTAKAPTWISSYPSLVILSQAGDSDLKRKERKGKEMIGNENK